ncbi:MAG TPA: UDP-N-acetylmuramoyl-tripeptide--D-alanyl-D-alanine ligase [Vicinamibacterales bacterium]
MTLTVADIVEAIGGRLLSGDGTAVLSGVSIDTRTLRAGDLYIAIRGDRLDGHDFVNAAFAGGAAGAVISQPMGTLAPAAVCGRALIVVPDTTGALQRLARWVRRKSGARVVAITGSAGKTTTKDMTAAFLGLRYRVMQSSGNLNNHIGLPLSLLELRHGAEVAVVELGMNHPGEISRLVQIAEPDVRVWTNVAEVHLEFFGSIEAIADAKAELFEGATATTILVANADDSQVMARAPKFLGQVVTFGTTAGSTVTASNVEDLGIDGMAARVATDAGTVRLEVPLLGRGNLQNVLASVAVARQFGVPLDAMAERARTLRAAAHRCDVMRLGGGVVVVDDAYNSNPRAVQGALAVVAGERRFARRVAVLGEMLELGAQALTLHEACGRAAAASGLSLLVTVGGESARRLGRAAEQAGMPESTVIHADSSGEAAEIAATAVHPGDLVLVKGSRGIKTERVVERLVSAFPA